MLRADFLYLVSIPLYLIILVVSAKKKIPSRKHIVIFLFFVYCLAVIAVTLFPLPVQKSVLERRRSPDCPNPKHNFMPIIDMVKAARLADFRTVARVMGGNVLLFIPLGVLLPVLNTRFNSLSSILLCGILGSLTIEGLQLLISLMLGLTTEASMWMISS